MEKIWLNQYPPNVPAEINPDTYHSLVELIDDSIMRYAERPAFYHLGKTLTYRELDQASRKMAAYLQHVLQLQKGDRLAIVLPNVLQYPVVLIAALRIGLIVVNVNPLYTADELTFQLNDSGAKVVVVLSSLTLAILRSEPRLTHVKHIITTDLTDMHTGFRRLFLNAILYFKKAPKKRYLPAALPFRSLLKAGQVLNLTPVAIHREEAAFLQYTGGTTGVSKGAILTHRNMIANLEQVDAWAGDLLKNGCETIVTALPMYHIFSLLANCLLLLKKGGLNLLITNPKDIPFMVKEMKKIKFTAITGVNTLFAALLRNPAFCQLDFRNLHFAMGGGMAVQRIVAEEWQAVTRVPLLEGYGLTEASPCVVVNPCYLHHFNGAIGLPLPSTEVEFLDNEGKPLPLGEAGELAIKGPQVMQGYWNNPEETAKIFTKDGWLLTGDIATMDKEGFIRILERKKDMILVSGFNVYPNEIEQVLAAMPGVRECAVIGVASKYTGEAVKAFIVRETALLTAEEVIHYCRKHLTSYKVPKLVEFCETLPKSHVGKILRRALRDKA